MINNFRANGKLLLTGEYLVMNGARALVLPLIHGQSLTAGESDKPGTCTWSARVKGEKWFSAVFDTRTQSIYQADDEALAEKLGRILRVVKELNPSSFKGDKGYRMETNLEFPRNYGWGSSSTLLSLLAQWAGIDAMELHRRLSEGSGYDVAAARRNAPFFFRLGREAAELEESRFRFPFQEQVFFTFLGHKQNSETAVRDYLSLGQPPENLINRISEIGTELSDCTGLDRFEDLLAEHEDRMGHHLGRRTLREQRFSDYPGVIKSLGAWGGDFALFVSRQGKEFLEDYLASKGIRKVFEMKDLFSLKNEN